MTRRRLGWGVAIVVAHLSVPTGAAAQRRGLQEDEPVLSRILARVDERVLRAHTTFLSDPLLEGRGPGTRGGAIAARYLASQLTTLGLQPAAPNGTFFQSVEMVGLTPEASLVVGSGRRTTAFAPLEDYVAWPERPDSSLTVDGDVVFVGYGIQAPEWNWDDFKGTPLAGKILLFLANDPGAADSTIFNGRSMTYYGWWTYKLEQAARVGAVGAILVHLDDLDPRSWRAVQSTWSGEQLLPRNRRRTTLRFASWITAAAARRLAQTAGVDFDVLVRRARASGFAPIGLGAHAAVHIRSQTRAVTAANVVARLEGRDSGLRDEALLYLAHYDHVGKRQAAWGDSVDYSAVDNAPGAASLLATAAAFAGEPTRMRRSLIFIFSTGAEPGLLGAKRYVAASTVPLERTVAVLNIDETLALGATEDAVALGAASSTLDSVFAHAVAAERMEVVEDPWPEGGRFFSSDHFPFARAGVPALQVAGGTRYRGRPNGWGMEQLRARVADRLHRPSDEAAPEADFAGVLQQARILIRMGWALAQTDQFPIWHIDSPYRPAGEQLRFLRDRRGSP